MNEAALAPKASRPIASAQQAEALLIELGAPERLQKHGRLVLEAAEMLIATLKSLDFRFDEELVRIGAIVHDAGKILHPNELGGGGAEHETSGERFLIEQGVEPKIARFCRSHARWDAMPCSLEELLVALADTLWKGVRRDDLEGRVIETIAERLGQDAWSLFVELDSCFERIADGGEERLRRSV